MDREMINRMKEAAKYQKMAIRALFPEQAAEHLDVIEGELKAMFHELVMDAVKQEMKKKFESEWNAESSENVNEESASFDEEDEIKNRTGCNRAKDEKAGKTESGKTKEEAKLREAKAGTGKKRTGKKIKQITIV